VGVLVAGQLNAGLECLEGQRSAEFSSSFPSTHLLAKRTLVVLRSPVRVEMMVVDALRLESFVAVLEAADVRPLVGVNVLLV
jgi:hypothetical protein